MNINKVLWPALLITGLTACGGDGGASSGGASSNSSSSSSGSSSSSSSSSGGEVTVREAYLEGFGVNTITGGEGGEVVYASTGDEIYHALCNRATIKTPIIIKINGTITSSNTSKIEERPNGCNIEGDKILFKDGAENVSLIGVGDKAFFDGVGIRLYKSVKNIIIQNIKIGKVSTNGGDAISLESDISNVWIDHNEIYAAGGESEGYDSLIDMKDGVENITVSYNYLYNSGRGGLVGSSSGDTDNTNVTFHHNWYQTIDSRTPLYRGRLGHSYNNYFNNISKSAINTRVGAKVLIENNVFEDVKNPIGTFYTSDMGYYDAVGNIFGDGVTWVPDDGNDEYPAGPDFNSSYHIDINVPYAYNLDPADQVKAIVQRNAGSGKITVE